MRDEKSTDLIERYLYDVVRRLPEEQRKDIEQELRTLIDDMVTERLENGAKNYEESVKEVLKQLGDPAKLAKGYRGDGNYLIGGEYYDKYCYILKIVLLCVGFGMLVSAVASAFLHVVEIGPQIGDSLMDGTLSMEHITDAAWGDIVNIGAIPMALLTAFGSVTLIFALMERKQVKMSEFGIPWSLDDLARIPHDKVAGDLSGNMYGKAAIKKGECVVEIVFSVLFLVLLSFAPQLFGAWVPTDGKIISIPLFNLSIWGNILPFFVICLGVGMVDDLVKLVAGRYTYTVMGMAIVTDLISLTALLTMFKTLPVWNVNFMSEISRVTGSTANAPQDILTYFGTNTFNNVILAVFFLIILLDIGTAVYYTVRYGEKIKQRG